MRPESKIVFDIVVIGGGHAGAEAAWAAGRLGASVALVTFDPTKIGAMSCNPAIGGLAKGQMVREIDALGGLMGLATDATGIQFRVLNRSKGPAVWGPRAQCDKYAYAAEVQRLLRGCPGVEIVTGEVVDVETQPSADAGAGADTATTVGTAVETAAGATGTADVDSCDAPAGDLNCAGAPPRSPSTAIAGAAGDTASAVLSSPTGDAAAASTPTDNAFAGAAPAGTTPAAAPPAAVPHVTGVRLADGTLLRCRAAIITTGTFLRALMHTGEAQSPGGRVGEAAAVGMSACLGRLGFELGRLKTGTPPRLSAASIDFSAFAAQQGDDQPAAFSFTNEYGGATAAGDAMPAGDATATRGEVATRDATGSSGGNATGAGSVAPPDEPYATFTDSSDNAPFRPPLPQVPCYIAATNPAIHELIRQNLHRAPMYSGQIQSTGPRYCPSIEDKVVRFADKESHPIYLEPEGLETDEIYCNGISTSLPADVQERVIAMIPGLENARILRHGYAVEYDMVWPHQVYATLQTKPVAGLFLAGQINGTSGYEEAAAQGLVAGVNAAHLVAGRACDFILRRDQAYIGVMIDDLVTKPPVEPYRMFTSRAEHRLLLRGDNADSRLTEVGRSIGLVDDARWAGFARTRDALTALTHRLLTTRAGGQSAHDLLRRHDTDWPAVVARCPELGDVHPHLGFRAAVAAKYEGYIARQGRDVERFGKLEHKPIPATIDYRHVPGLRNEARQQLLTYTPHSLGQALRLTGITPADVTVLAIYLEKSAKRSIAAV